MHINKHINYKNKLKTTTTATKNVSAQDGATALDFAKANPSRLYSSLEVQAVVNALKQVRIRFRVSRWCAQEGQNSMLLSFWDYKRLWTVCYITIPSSRSIRVMSSILSIPLRLLGLWRNFIISLGHSHAFIHHARMYSSTLMYIFHVSTHTHTQTHT